MPGDWGKELEWVADPTNAQPAGWDDEPARIPDPGAFKPPEWDDEMDGEYDPATIPNPGYKGVWVQRTVRNPAYANAQHHVCTV